MNSLSRVLTILLSLVLLTGSAAGMSITSSTSGDWATAGNWNPASVPTNTDDVAILNGFTMTINDTDTHYVKSLTIQSGGTVEHAANSDTELYKAIIDAVTHVTVNGGGSINVNGKGYDQYDGPGNPVSGAGASYGGRGGLGTWSATGTPGDTYGSITSPTNLGSGSDRASTYGGGTVQITAAAMTNNGTISTDGLVSGSGGSAFITTGTISGSGTISARGSDGASSSYGDGGGGRIAVILTGSTDFGSITFQAPGGAGSRGAGAGTIYMEHTGHAAGQGILRVDNDGVTSANENKNEPEDTIQNSSGSSTYTFKDIELFNSGVFIVDSDDNLTLTGELKGDSDDDNEGLYVNGGTLNAPASLAWSNAYLRVAPGSTFDPSSSITIQENAILYVDGAHTLSAPVTVQSGGNLSHWFNDSTAAETYKTMLTLDSSLTVDLGGSADVSGQGHREKWHSSQPVYSGPGAPAGSTGAGYGGRGGRGTTTLAGTPGNCYGSVTAPTNIGACGTYGASYGGGAIILDVLAVTNNGVIAADGNDSAAGGTVYITTGTLSGNGTIRANGGIYAASQPGNGGGGRVAVVLTNSTDFGSMTFQAYGGVYAGWEAAAGTVYLRTKDQAEDNGKLIIDNDGNVPDYGYVTEISSNVTDTAVGEVILQNEGALQINTNQSLTVSRVWTNEAPSLFTALTGSTVEFVATNTATVYGDTAFERLVCTNVSKRIDFEAGASNDVQDQLVFAGPSDTSLVLRSTSPGTQWLLDVDGGASLVSVSYVDVEYSDARPGQNITASTSKDSGNNSNWTFSAVGQTNIWIGTTTDWNADGNWSLGRPPQEIDGGVIISNNCAAYPSLLSDKTFGYFEMKDPSSLSLAGYDLTVEDEAIIAGTLAATGTETLAFEGDVNFTSGTFTQAQSTVLLAGSGAQSMTSAGESCYRLTVTNSGRTVTFADPVSATYFRNESVSLTFNGGVTATEFRAYTTDGSITQKYAAASTSTITDMFLLGSAGKTNWLQSTSGGSQWTVNVSRVAYVLNANVEDSDADPGVTIYPIDSVDTGLNNDNWVFTETWLTWDGSDSTAFGLPANWTPPAAPDATARVNIDGNYVNPPTVDTAISVLEVLLGGDQTSVLTVDDSLIVGENLRVMGFGTLTANKPIVVSNDVSFLDGASVSHDVNAASEANKIDLTVLGSMTVESGAAIDVNARGYSTGNGPGACTSPSGASYGGKGNRGTGSAAGVPGLTYGSIMSPTNLGSASAVGSSYGGGAILLDVTGSLTHNGSMLCNGTNACAGGSVYIRANSLAGTGTIYAQGGANNNPGSPGGQGGGGRIAVVLAGSDSFGSVNMNAYGGNSTFDGGAGTIYLEGSSDGAGGGQVIIDNDSRTQVAADGYGPQLCFTVLPPETDAVANELANARGIVTNSTRVTFTNDFNMADWHLAAGATNDLNGRTLTTRALNVAGVEQSAGMYTEADFADVTGSGYIIVPSAGMVILIR